MPRRIDISKINFSGLIMLMLLVGLMAAAMTHPPSEYRVPKITEQDRRVTAYHESGHALLAANLPASGGILHVTIVSRWGMLGSLTQAPASGRESTSRHQARRMAELVIAMGGLIAEEILLPSDAATEARTSDIKRAEKIAYELLGGPDSGLTPAAIETAMRRLTQAAEQRARDILSAHETQLHALAANLLRQGTLSGAEIAIILDGGALQEPREKTG
jgi:ATP-dependent Zn protease